MLSDKLIECKLGCYVSVASEVEPFLTKFQSDQPVVPLLYDEPHSTVRALMKRYIKSGRYIKSVIVDSAATAAQLAAIVTKASNLKQVQEISIGFAAKAGLKKCNESDLGKLTFLKKLSEIFARNDCKVTGTKPTSL